MATSVNLGPKACDTNPFSEKPGATQSSANQSRVTGSFLEQLKVLEYERKKITSELSVQESRMVEQDRKLAEQDEQLQALAQDRVSLWEELHQVRKDTEHLRNKIEANQKVSPMTNVEGNRQFTVDIGMLATAAITAVVILTVTNYIK